MKKISLKEVLEALSDGDLKNVKGGLENRMVMPETW
jgi:hypothetical protein